MQSQATPVAVSFAVFPPTATADNVWQDVVGNNVGYSGCYLANNWFWCVAPTAFAQGGSFMELPNVHAQMPAQPCRRPRHVGKHVAQEVPVHFDPMLWNTAADCSPSQTTQQVVIGRNSSPTASTTSGGSSSRDIGRPCSSPEKGASSSRDIGRPACTSAEKNHNSGGPSSSWWTVAGSALAIAQLAETGNPDKIDMLQQISDSAWEMAIKRNGCRVVQKALEVADRPMQVVLVKKLEGRVIQAIKSPHANYVLQRSIVLLPTEHLQFVIDEIRGHVVDLARHRYGCRVLQRIIEHFSQDAVAGLVDEMLGSVAELCPHEFGNYVLQHMLEYGGQRQRTLVVEAMLPKMVRLAKHRIGSNVVERALLYASAADRQLIIDSLASKDLTSLSRSCYGSFVVRQLTRTEGM